MSTAKHSATIPFGPSAPQLTLKNLRDQFWADVYGKEVQTTATYSYTWVADQFGHICLGLIGNFAATALCGVVITLLGWSPRISLRHRQVARTCHCFHWRGRMGVVCLQQIC